MSSYKTTETHLSETNNNIKKNKNKNNSGQNSPNVDNNYILNNIVWFNPKQPSVLKRQISEKQNSDDISDKVTIEELMNYLDNL